MLHMAPDEGFDEGFVEGFVDLHPLEELTTYGARVRQSYALPGRRKIADWSLLRASLFNGGGSTAGVTLSSATSNVSFLRPEPNF